MDAACSHLGADLGRWARLIGDCIECPFHGWRVRSRRSLCAACLGLQPPARVREAQQVFPAAKSVTDRSISFMERNQRFRFPSFWMKRRKITVRSRARSFTAPCTWYMVNAHAFDVQHFLSVHGRPPARAACTSIRPRPMARRSSYLCGSPGREVLRPLSSRSMVNGREVAYHVDDLGRDVRGRHRRLWEAPQPLSLSSVSPRRMGGRGVRSLSFTPTVAAAGSAPRCREPMHAARCDVM